LIYKRQTVENYYRNAQKNVRDYQLTKSNVEHWEKDGVLYENKLEKEKRMEEEARVRNKLEKRKHILREVLAEDERRHQHELKINTITNGMRMKAIEKEALRLEEINQKEKREYIKKAEQKRLLAQSDELRQEKSRLLMKFCDLERRQMTQDKQMQRENDEREKQSLARSWLENAGEKNRIAEEKEKVRLQQEKKLYNYIENQIQTRQQTQNERNQELEAEKMQIRKQLEQMALDYDEKCAEMAKLKQQKRLESLQDLRESERIKREKEEQLAQDDLEWVASVVAKEKQKACDTHAAKEVFRQDQLSYISYNRKLREAENEKNKMIEKYMNEEQEKEWLKREHKWNQERDAKLRLMKEVEIDRQKQLKEKHIRYGLEKSRKDEYHNYLMKNLNAMNKKEQEKQEGERRDQDQRRQEIQMTLKQREQRKLQQKENEIEEFKNNRGRYEEIVDQEIERMRKEAAENPEEFFNNRKTQSKWFS